jgi:selenocysteine-specific elongation factor
MKHLILGTAGHVDHGKTSLVKALTGVDCDRLKEEKSRGITIELGFARLELPGGISFGVVDVPGHERFVRTMVAGAAGMDIVMLVVAADEGVMPQTREHLDICRLLGVKSGLVVLTKSDLVEADWLELLREELREELAGSFLEGVPIVAVSTRTGTGIDRLRLELARMAADCSSKKRDGAFRLPVDRVFTAAGFGTVVTGTLLSGALKVGDELSILPGGISSRVRGLQTHGGKCEAAEAGERLAVNLHGVEQSAVARGDTLVPPAVYTTTSAVDVLLRLLPSAPRALKHRATLRLHAATYEVAAQVILLDRDSLAPGEESFAQLRLPQPVLLSPGDPFVLRNYSPPATVGGGRVLDPAPSRRRRRSAAAVDLLTAIAAGAESRMLSLLVATGLLSGLSHADLLNRSGFTSRKLEALLLPLLAGGEVLQMTREPRLFLCRESFTALQDHLCRELEAFLGQNPLKEGIGREELKSRLPQRSDARFFTGLLAALEKDGRVLAERDIVRLSGRSSGSPPGSGALQEQLAALLTAAGYEPPSLKELAAGLAMSGKEVLVRLHALGREGRAVRVKSDLFYGREPLEEIREKLTLFLRTHKEITPNEFRELTGLSRKFMIPLLEYFDQEKLTIRVGEKRQLRRK